MIRLASTTLFLLLTAAGFLPDWVRGADLPPDMTATTAAPAEPPAPSVTLQQVVALALRNSQSLQQSANTVATADIDVRQARANFAPDLNLQLSANARESAALGASQSSGTSLSSSLNLFRGFGDLAALRAAAETLAAGRESLSRAEQDLIFTVTNQYVAAVTAAELIAVRQDDLDQNRQQLERIDALVRAGSRPRSDLFQQQATTGKAELALIQAQRDATKAWLQLWLSSGIAPPSAPLLLAPPPLPAPLVATEEPGMLAQRADLLAQERRLAATRQQISQARAGYWPNLALSASAGSDYASVADPSLAQQYEDNRYAAVGLTLSVPLFDRAQTRYGVATARIAERNAQLDLARLRLQATQELEQALQDDRATRQQLVAAEQQLVAATEALAAMEARYRVGAATLVELAQARAEFVAARYATIQARDALLPGAMAIAHARGDGVTMSLLLNQGELKP